MNQIQFFSTVLAISLLSSCDDERKCISGEGTSVDRNYDVPTFNQFAYYGPGEVYATVDSSVDLRISAQLNVLEALQVDVNGGELQIGKDDCFRNHKTIRTYFSSPSLSAVSLSGSSNFVCTDIYRGNSFYGEISGSGSMSVNVDVKNLYLESSGSGEFWVSGITQTQSIEISGSADVHAFDTRSHHCSVEISGSGDVEVFVTGQLDIEISGSGTVYYRGNPVIKSDISGSGQIVNRN